MDLTYMAIIVLAAMIFVLSGMVGYLYWQQTRLTQQIQSLAFAISSHLAPQLPAPVVPVNLDTEPTADASPEVEEESVQEAEIAEDDRASVEHVEGPVSTPSAEEEDIDDYQLKTVKQLQDVLTKKGVPFGKRDSKTVLLELLKATT